MAVRPGDTLTLAIERPVAGGAMLARCESGIVFVSGAIPGERVEAQVHAVRRQAVFARVTRVLEASPDRMGETDAAPCGGHVYGHIGAARQAALKGEIVVDAFRRIAHLTPEAPVAVTAAAHEGYRMRARLHVSNGRAGFLREGTHALCDPGPTRQLRPVTLERLNALSPALDRTGVTALELTETQDGAAWAVHLEGGRPPRRDSWPAVEGLRGVSWAADARDPGQVVAGTPWVEDAVTAGGRPVVLRRQARAFFQGNRYLLQPLVDHVVAALRGGSVLDLYAGVGLFSAAATAADHEVLAVEGDRISAEDLSVNAAAWSSRLRTRHAPVERVLAEGVPKPDILVLDPPRTGASPEAGAALTGLGAARVIYVSCDVATLARDVRLLVSTGYRLTHLQAFDLFPQTAHVETVAVFDRA